VVRNMRSVGLDLRRWAEADLLRTWAVRPTEFGLEDHLAIVSRLLAEHDPAVVVVDGIASLIGGPTSVEVLSMLAREFHMFKARGITVMATILTDKDTESAIGMSSRADTWLLLRNVESNGERDRLLYVLKSRGTAHSNQVREFVLTDHGVELVDVYVGPTGVMTGTARLSQEISERDARLQQQEDLRRRERELQRGIMHGQAQLATLQDEIAAQQAELERIADREERLAADAQAAQRAMGTRRWADPGEDDEEEQR
jgi:circadian clock protein KaiC